MVEITPDFVGNSFVIVLISYIIAFAFQLFMMYLNWKQSKVQNQMKDLIKEVEKITDEVKDIRKILEKK